MIPEEIKNTEDNLLRYKERIANFSKEFEIGLFLYLLKKSRFSIFLVFIIAASIGYVYLRYTPNLYQTSSTIQINIKDQAT